MTDDDTTTTTTTTTVVDVDPCADCDGTGIIDEGQANERECPACDGTGDSHD